MSTLSVNIIQTSLAWESITGNLNHISDLISQCGKTDIIVLPEMFTTGFSMDTDLAEPMDGWAVKWMKKQAADRQCVLAGSLMIKEEGHFYNRFVWMQPDGQSQHYDKRHLFSYADEHKYFHPGQKNILIEYKNWRIRPLICYDLRFPVWARNTDAYDLLIYVANWPEKRSFAWKHLLQARAIENQAYCIGVNRVGMDGKDIPYSGDSSIIQYDGEILFRATDEEIVHKISLEKEKQESFRERFQFLADRDKFQISS